MRGSLRPAPETMAINQLVLLCIPNTKTVVDSKNRLYAQVSSCT